MKDGHSANNIARELEHTLYRLEGLSILPAAAAVLLRSLFEMRLSPGDLNSIAESEPALAVMLFSLLHREGVHPEPEKTSIRTAVQNLPLRQIRDSFFSAKIYTPADNDPARLDLRKNLAAFASAVGCCARAVAEQGSADIEPELACAAGLLHNIGNLALDEAMPRSFQKLLEQAKTQQLCITEIQQQNLGLDYTIIGKRLAQRWRMPEPIVTAIWLHQSDTETIVSSIPQAKIAQVVRLACLIAKKAGIGISGSFDATELSDELLNSLAITKDQAEQIGAEAVQETAKRSKYLGSDMQTDITGYCSALQFAAGQLAGEGSKLTQQMQQSHTKSSHFDFTAEFLTSLAPAAEPLEIARRFACLFKKFYQTGKVCLYLKEPGNTAGAEAVIAEDNDNIHISRLTVPADTPAVPESIAGGFSVIDAARHCNWIFQQLDVEFDKGQTKIAPLIAEGSALGAILFEFSYPVQTTQLQEMFKATSFIAATLLEMAIYRQKQQHLAEDFAKLITKSPVSQKPPIQQSQTTVLHALAEMAAGAAHELNNPLAIVSGRAQLLAESETDPAKKQILEQIQTNSRKLADIVNDLMSYADPAPPRKTHTNLDQLLQEAVQLASLKTAIDNINVQIDLPEDDVDVFVDSGQIAPVLANIICNALQSYDDPTGPVKISAKSTAGSVKLNISDAGCGMDADTLQKATYPFFSSKSAGRMRGMGLAHAARLIELNSGSLEIVSEPGQWTTAIVTLPR